MPSSPTSQPKEEVARAGLPASLGVDASHLRFPMIASGRFSFRPFAPADIATLRARAARDCMGITSIGLIHPATVEFGQLCGYGTVATETPAAFHWAATMIGEDEVAGYAGLNRIDVASRQGELRILVGTGNKNSGYAIEWAVAILRWALVGADFGRVYALQLTRHPIAGQVLSTVGMLPEAMLRKRLHHDGPFEDVVCWSITKEEWIDRCPTT